MSNKTRLKRTVAQAQSIHSENLEGATKLYMASKQHVDRLQQAIERESKRLNEAAQMDVLWSISDAFGSLYATCAFLKTIGMRENGIAILKGALKMLRTPPSAEAKK